VKSNGKGPAGSGAGHPFRKWHRRAALQRLHDRDPVHQAVVVVGLFRFVGHAGVAQDFPRPVKADYHRDVDVGVGARGGRRSPAGLDPRKNVLDGVDGLTRLRERSGRARQQERCPAACPPNAAPAGMGGNGHSYLMSEATCTFTIKSGSVTAPPCDPGGAFLSLSTTSMPATTSPITVYWLSSGVPSSNMMKN